MQYVCIYWDGRIFLDNEFIYIYIYMMSVTLTLPFPSTMRMREEP